MRKIKFRAWDKEFNSMVFQHDMNCTSENKEYLFSLNTEDVELLHYDEDYSAYVKCNADIMQYTGLKDVEDNEIYEGDIVEYKTKSFTNIGQIKYGLYDEEYQVDMGFYIQWLNSDGLRNDLGYWKDKGVKVIGNIFENNKMKIAF